MKVKFVPQDVEFEIKPNQSVLQVAQEHGLHIQSVCKGIPSCAECRITIDEGENNVMPPSQAELNLIGTAHFVDHRRLSCQLRCFGNVTVNLKEQVEKAEHVASSKRPRGYVQKAQGEESQAVMGNIMQDAKEMSQTDLNERTANLSLQEEEIRRELARVKSKKGHGSDDSSGDGSRRSRSGRNRSNQGGESRGDRPRRNRGDRSQQRNASSEGGRQGDRDGVSSSKRQDSPGAEGAKKKSRSRRRKPKNKGASGGSGPSSSGQRSGRSDG